jgi:uncharacterized coiled-coil protein SlyX
MQSKTTTFSLIALCALLSALLFWRVSATNSEKRGLEAHITSLTQDLANARQTATRAPAVTEPPHEAKLPPNPAKPAREIAQLAASSAAIAKLNDDLAIARTRISELESKVLSLAADKAAIAQQRQQDVTASEETCRARIADAQRSVETVQSDLRAAQQRLEIFETENENLRKSQAVARAMTRSSAVPQNQLDDLSRRRDAYLKSLIRRYREIDNDYRSYLRDPQGLHPSDPAILRIQATLSQAEEDLRQIDSLDAKTLLVEKRREKN